MTDDIRPKLTGARFTLAARFSENLTIALARGKLYASLVGIHYKRGGQLPLYLITTSSIPWQSRKKKKTGLQDEEGLTHF